MTYIKLTLTQAHLVSTANTVGSKTVHMFGSFGMHLIYILI